MAQPCPACMDAVNAAIEQAALKSASSRTTRTPTYRRARNTFLTVGAAAITARRSRWIR